MSKMTLDLSDSATHKGCRMKRIRFNLTLTEEMHAKLIASAERAGLTITGYILKRCGFKPLAMGRPPMGVFSTKKAGGSK